jgi:hypothetical protein
MLLGCCCNSCQELVPCHGQELVAACSKHLLFLDISSLAQHASRHTPMCT